jgi:GT2 family glycosyltransferase
MRAVDLSIVTYQPDFALLQQLLDSLSEPAREALRRNLYIEDNSTDPAVEARLRALPSLLAGGAFDHVEIHRSGANLGFGRGHNANFARGAAPWFLVLNQDCVLEPGALDTVLDAAASDEARVAAWELRQIPFEHPKAYDSTTLEVDWVSGAAALFRRTAYAAMRGFEERIFMYGEDVDLSWRLRAAGWKLRYTPRAAVLHRTYTGPMHVKPLQVFGGVYANLALRLRFGGLTRLAQGLALYAAELAMPASFPGRRRGLARAGLRLLRNAPYFIRTRVPETPGFRPHFAAWGYEVRRDGAFHELRSQREHPRAATPLVSIMIRTLQRPAWLREALASVANQTYPNIVVIVVEDGPESSRAVIEEFASRLAIDYHATGERVGRARAGNLALARARGEWLNFLDDDDLFFADHVEVLMDAVGNGKVAGAYGLAWETRTSFVDRERAHYEERLHTTPHRQPFDRVTLWHHNYLPIQAVLFNRRLYEKHGGFAEDMDQLEDWNLWTRYTLEDDFVLVEKTTSKYRVPADERDAAGRQALLDKAYFDALERQRAMRLEFSPRQVAEMADAYARSQALMMVTRTDMRRVFGGNRLLSWLAHRRRPLVSALRRRRLLR